jgi:hypothetical protein
MRKTLTTIVAIAVLMVVSAVPAAAKVDHKVFITERDVDMTVTLCDGSENVHISGTEHWEYNVFETKTGGEHINWKGYWDVTATGLSTGDEYPVKYSLHQVANGKAPAAPPTSQVLTHRVTMRIGSGPQALTTTEHSHRVLDFKTLEVKVQNWTTTSSC